MPLKVEIDIIENSPEVQLTEAPVEVVTGNTPVAATQVNAPIAVVKVVSQENVVQVTAEQEEAPVQVVQVAGGTGQKGWSPLLALIIDGNRRILQVVDWAGGEGIKPATGGYLGTSGIVSDPADAIDVRGSAGADGDPGTPGTPGADGTNGWSPILAVVADGTRQVLQVVDWTGGTGLPPATGLYVGPLGLVADIADAVRINGSVILFGDAAPSDDLGSSGDLYIDRLSGDVFSKEDTYWLFELNLKGPPGSQILFGSGPPADDLGVDGDVYIDIDNGDYYQKEDTYWVFVVALGSGGGTGLPAGGIAGDILVKQSSTDGDAAWATPTFAQDANVVHKTGDETVAGVKDFTSIPTGPAVDPTTDNQLTRKKYVDDALALKANDDAVVHKTGDETIAGIKEFTSIPLGPAASPTTDNQLARKKYVDDAIIAAFAANDAMRFRGGIDCSANPNYPAADAGDAYRVTVAGRIGGASGPKVEPADLLLCIVDGSAAGNHATVGANWIIVQANIDGAVIGPASSGTGNVPTFSDTSGKNLQDSGIALSSLAVDANVVHKTGAETVAGVKDFTSIPTGPAVDPTTANQLTRKAYVDGLDTANVKLTGDQTVVGIKTFSSSPIVPTPSYNDNTTKVATMAALFAWEHLPSSIKTADYTFDLNDEQVLTMMNAATALNLTVPPNSTAAFPLGTILYATRHGAGAVTVVAGAGVTLESDTSVLTARRHALLIFWKRATDTWKVFGVDLLSTKADDASVVHLTGNETVAGIKTFSSVPVTSGGDPVNANDLCRKSYVDALVTAGGFTAATQAQMEAGSSNTVGVTPLSFKWSDAALKCWGKANGAGTTLQSNLNVTSITDNGAGDITFTFGTNFSGVHPCCVQSILEAGHFTSKFQTVAAGSCRIRSIDETTGALTDPTNYFFMAAGDF